MDVFLLIYVVIAGILLTVLMGVLLAIFLGLEWYRHYRDARLKAASRQSSVNQVLPVTGRSAP